MRATLAIILFGYLATSPIQASVFYAAPTGSSSNNGLSTNSPWPLAYAMANAGASNIIYLMDGLYSSGATVAFTVSAPYQTLKAINKWGPKFYNIGSPDGTGGVIRCLDFDGVGTVIDGLSFSNCQYDAILFHQFGLSNCVARNCWIRNTGQTWGGSSGSCNGIEIFSGLNVLIENCLCEYNGTSGSTPGYNHGIYGGGTNGIYRNNVLRYNGGLGLSIDGHSGRPDVNNQVYNNLVYGNLDANDGATSQQLDVYNDGYSSGHNATNYIFGNTVISKGTYPIYCQDGNIYITNNIIVNNGTAGAGIGRSSSDPSQIWVDYNIKSVSYKFNGPHDVITNGGFVNPANGLYWLTSASPARGHALSGVYGPIGFFGNAQSSVSDVGAFQYNSTLNSDTRILDPSPANPDYWASPAGTNSGGSASITISPPSQAFGSIPVGTTADQTFTVLNSGTATLSGSASVPAPFTVVSGSPYVIQPGQTASVTIRYSPTASETDSQTVTFTGANGATATVSGSVVSTSGAGSLSFQANGGAISGPFIITNGGIYQAVSTAVTNGGRAVYNFIITNSGSYVIQTVVDAPDTTANSFYVNIDADPVDPTMTWDIMPVTSGFEQRLVSWRGNGTAEADQFVPQTFDLAVGAHQLIIIGREPNTVLQSLSILEVPSAPLNLHIIAGP